MIAKRANLLRHSVRLAALLLLASCGGGGDVEPAGDTSGRAKTEQAAAFFPPTTIPADAGTRGMWSPVYDWPLIAVHSVLLPDGRLLTYGTTPTGEQSALASYDIWDTTGAPNAGHLSLPNGTGTDLFCSSSVLLPAQSPSAGASVLIAGGDNWIGTQVNNTANPNSNVLDVQTGTLTRLSDMKRSRWYSTSTTLINGETYIQGGSSGGDRPEIRGLDGVFRLLSSADTSTLDTSYPRNFVASDGRVFGFDSNGKMYYVNTLAAGSVQMVGQMSASLAGWTGSAAMFSPGRILRLAGNSNAAAVIDITLAGTPSLTATQSLSSQRQWVNATILADGKVLATGGSQVDNQLVGVNNKAEIWNPITGQWIQGPSAVRARLYHSNAILLPDASVLISGGGAVAPGATVGTGPADNLNAELYYPPYFFTSAGQRAARPVITSAPNWIDIGKVFTLDLDTVQPASRVTMVKTGATTHSNNMDQRFVELTFSGNGSRLAVQGPSRAADAPPGYYMLFVFDAAGVPSVAKIVRVGIAAVTNPAIVPTIANPGAQSTDRGTAVTLALVGSDPNGDALTFAASGLPPGLLLNPGTGAISGAPTVSGAYSVVVSVSDGVNVGSASFLWTVNANNAVILDPLPPVQSAQSGSATTFTASAQGGTNVMYRWNFGDGTGDTPWASNATVSHVFGSPGTYSVTLSVIDDSGFVQSRSFLQTVYLPATTNKPAVSTNIAVQVPASGNPLLWVVNQDNDSVSAFDIVTRVKRAEIAVGAAPRSVAVAPNGLVWVTNKRSDSITVINPATFTVVNTVALGRGSQPFGIVMSPTAGQAFVALEASGQLLKIDTTSFAQTGNVSVGPNPRQLSVSADGVSVYVARFITRALPGEGTATVNPTPSTGGEVVMVTATGMSVSRTIVLRHSDMPDLENQGRGIPNYLGAPTISPDGSQAYVPSKQDNVKRGALRDGSGLNFQSTVRAVSSRIVLATNQEDLSRRVDHDNASVASAAAFDARGVYLFVALETSREVAVVDAHGGQQVMRFEVGRAPQGLALSPDGTKLFVNNFMDRTVGVYDLAPLLTGGQLSVPLLTTLGTVTTERLAPTVLAGKQFFYDARDARLARDRYMSCASCHNDGGDDGRVWDFTGQGEGLRNTISLRGRAGMSQGPLHWSANFDEVQDFEGQIRMLAGGTGLMNNADFAVGTRSQPLGTAKAGVSADLDALAAYVNSLDTFEPSPFRPSGGALSATATAGRAVFLAQNCASCHGGSGFTNSALMGLQNIGTLKPSSGNRLGIPLTGIDVPTLRDAWRTAPYLHDGSAATLEEAVLLHNGLTVSSADLTSLVQYLREIGSDESSAPGGAGLNGTSSSAIVGLDLTSVGTADWVQFGVGAAPGIVRKAGGGGQIGGYAVVGGGLVTSYADDQRTTAWSDGTPTASSSTNRNGVYIDGMGNGYSLTVPASNTSRTVTMLVGGWNSGGTFRAHLGDGSMVDYVDTTAVATGSYYRTYTITYAAASTTTLTLTWTQSAGPSNANVTLKAVALSTAAPGPTNSPPVVSTPAAQTSTVGQVVSLAISASDPNGDTLSYSASGLPAGLSINASSGLISGTPTTVGSSSVTVTVNDGKGGSASASFGWTVQAVAGTGSLSGVVSTATGAVNLTTLGTADWVQFGVGSAVPGIVRKASGGSQISGYTIVGVGPAKPYNDDLRSTSWSDGTPTASGTNDRSGLYIDAVGNGYSITVPAVTGSRTVTLLVGGWESGGTFRAHLGDGSAADYVNTTATVAGSYYRVYTITYAAASTTTLTLTWTQSAGPSNANVTLKAVALSAVAGPNNPPVITTPAAQTSTVGQVVSLAISASDPNGDTLSYSVSGLPAGLNINASSGLISGTPTTIGASSVTVTVNDGKGGSANASFGWTVQATPNSPPVVSTPAAQTSTVGQVVSLAISASDPNGDTLSYSASGLPAGLSINASSGLISGTPTTVGSSSVTVTVNDGKGGSANASFGWTVQATPNSPPVVSTPAAQTSTVGQVVSLAISASDPNGDTLSYSASGLPAGLSINASSGLISGTPTTVGSSSVTVTVNDGKGGSASASFGWTVQAVAGTGSLSGVVSTATGAVNLTTLGTADWVQFGVGSAVPGIVRKASGGSQISGYTIVGVGPAKPYNDDLRSTSWSDGTPTASGTNDRSGLYIDAVGNGYSITVPAVTGSRTVTLLVGGWESGGTFRAHLGDGSAADYVNTTATVAGSYYRVYTITYAAASTTTLTLTWTQSAGPSNANVTLKAVALSAVAGPNNPPVITTPAAQTSTVGQVVSLAISASDPNGDTLSYSVSGLPAGLNINASSGLISGTPTTIGASSVTVTVNDGKGGSANASFGWTVQATPNSPPVVSTPAAQTSTVGQVVSLAISASDPNGDTLSYSVSGLPAGLNINASSGLISGTPTTIGASSVTVTVNDGKGGSANASFGWTVQATPNSPPVVSTPAAQTSTVGQVVSLAISASDPNGDTLSYSASGLPAGLSINASSGLISGTPTTVGSSSVTVTVNDGKGGSASASFGWTVQAVAGTGSLSGVVSTATGAVNLTTLGTADWVQFGVGSAVPGIVRKASGGSQIGGYTIVGVGPAKPYNDDLRRVSWSDGTPTVSGTNSRSGVYIDAVGNGYSITVPASTGSRTVTILVGGWRSGGTFRAHLGDGSAADYVNTTATASGNYYRTYTVTYRAASSGSLTLTWVQASGTGNVTIKAVTLSGEP